MQRKYESQKPTYLDIEKRLDGHRMPHEIWKVMQEIIGEQESQRTLSQSDVNDHLNLNTRPSIPTQITRERLKAQVGDVHPTSFADILRQSAGMSPVDPEGKPLGSELAKAKRNLPVTSKQSENQRLVYAWLDHETATTEDIPTVETMTEEIVSATGLLKLELKISNLISEFIAHDPTGKRKELSKLFLHEATSKDSIPYTILLAFKKIQVLLLIDGLDQVLKNNLQEISDFYEQDLIPLIKLKDTEQSEIDSEIDKYLKQPNLKRDESYKEKAKRVLIDKKSFISKRTYENQAPQSKLDFMAKSDALELPGKLQLDTIELATSVNHLRLLEVLQEKGVDLIKVKDELGILINDYLDDTKDGWLNRRRKEYTLKKIIKKITSVTKVIYKEFPHDTVYLLSQVLKDKKATCAGKSSMANHIFRDLGLDTSIIGMPEHLANIIRIGEIILVFDLNMAGLLPGQHHLATLHPKQDTNDTSEHPNIPPTKQKYSRDITIFDQATYLEYSANIQTHSVFWITESDFSQYNFANILFNNIDYFLNYYPSRAILLDEIKRLYIADYNASGKNDLIDIYGYTRLLGDNIEHFSKDYQSKTDALYNCYQLHTQFLKNEDLNSQIRLSFTNLLYNNINYFSQLYGSRNEVLMELKKQYEYIIKNDQSRKSIAQNNLVILLNNYKGEFLFGYSSEAALLYECHSIFRNKLRNNSNVSLLNNRYGKLLFTNTDYFESMYYPKSKLFDTIEGYYTKEIENNPNYIFVKLNLALLYEQYFDHFSVKFGDKNALIMKLINLYDEAIGLSSDRIASYKSYLNFLNERKSEIEKVYSPQLVKEKISKLEAKMTQLTQDEGNKNEEREESAEQSKASRKLESAYSPYKLALVLEQNLNRFINDKVNKEIALDEVKVLYEKAIKQNSEDYRAYNRLANLLEREFEVFVRHYSGDPLELNRRISELRNTAEKLKLPKEDT